MGQLKDPWLNYGDYIKIDNLAARAGSNEFVVLHPVSGWNDMLKFTDCKNVNELSVVFLGERMLPFFSGGYIMKTKEYVILNKIHQGAKSYKEHLLGKVFMFVYNDTFIEVLFKKSCFLHLTGVATNLYADDFFKKALKKKGLMLHNISYDQTHPIDLILKKVFVLKDLYKVTIKEVFIIDNIVTATANYRIGVTDIEIVILFGPDINKNGELVSSYLIPYSLRVENIANNKFGNMFEIEYTFVKENGQKKYAEISYKGKKKISEFPDKILGKLDESLLEK